MKQEATYSQNPVAPLRTAVPVTVILLTLNEAHHLPDALRNVAGWAEEVFIVDSLSTDRTVDIALEHGARIVQRPFTNFGDQWNFALEKLPVTTPWTMKLDPDERLSSQLKESIAEGVMGSEACDGYEMMRRLWFMGRPLHVVQPVLRLWKTGKCRFSDVLVNEHPLIDGNVGQLKGLMEHHDSRDLHHWWEKQNRYTTMEAVMRVRGDALAAEPRLFGSPLERRMWLKKAFFRVPFRYQLYWLQLVLLRGVWRAGSGGVAWAQLRTEVLRMRELKAKEIRMRGTVPIIPCAPAGDYDPRVLASELQRRVFPRDVPVA